MTAPALALLAAALGQASFGYSASYGLEDDYGESGTKLVVKVGQDPADDAAAVSIGFDYAGGAYNGNSTFGLQALWFRTANVVGAGTLDAVIVDRFTGAVYGSSVLQVQPHAWIRWPLPIIVPVNSINYRFELKPQAGTNFELDNLLLASNNDLQRGIQWPGSGPVLSSYFDWLDADGGTVVLGRGAASQVFEVQGIDDPFSVCGSQPLMIGNPYVDQIDDPVVPSQPLTQTFAIGSWDYDVPPPDGVWNMGVTMDQSQPVAWQLSSLTTPTSQGTSSVTVDPLNGWSAIVIRPLHGFMLPEPDGGPVSFQLTVNALDAGSTWRRLSIGEPGLDPCHPIVRATYGGAIAHSLDDAGYGSDYLFGFDVVKAKSYYPDQDHDGFGDSSKAIWYAGDEQTNGSLQGYVLVGGDCDDSNPLVGPGFTEYCNGIDDSCDGLIDSADPNLQLPPCELDAGVCATAIRPASTCVDGGIIVCPASAYGPSFQPIESACDGLDNDCDGFTDAVDPDLVIPPCERDAGVCSTAMRPLGTCTDAGWTACDAADYGSHFESPEVSCDGLDNDCDGLVDDVGSGPLCSEQRGVCAGAHAALCSSGSWALCGAHEFGPHYEPVEVSCDGLDNDCDGFVDTADPDLAPPACAQHLGVCAGATHSLTECTASGWSACADADYGPDFEAIETRCDGLDNDCDGTVDEGCPMPPKTSPATGVVSAPAASGCGCSNATSATVWPVALALLALRRRRSQ